MPPTDAIQREIWVQAQSPLEEVEPAPNSDGSGIISKHEQPPRIESVSSCFVVFGFHCDSNSFTDFSIAARFSMSCDRVALN